MPLNATQFIDFSGVDSRSNPLALPYGKFLRLRNAKVTPDHHLELREGYTPTPMTTVVNVPIHSMTGMDLISGGTIMRYIVFGQTTFLKSLNMSTGLVTVPTVRGAAIASSNPWSFAVADDGKLYAYNGTDKKFFDGLAWRDTGLRAPTLAEVAGTTVTVGAADPNGVPASTVGGAQPGYQFYLSLYNALTGQVSNCIKIGGRVVPGVASDINIGTIPNYAGIDSEWTLLVGRTVDGGVLPYVIDDTSGNWIYVPNGNTSAVITQSGIDNNAAMPQRSDLPQAFDKVARVGARFYGNTPNSPTIWKSQANYDATIGKFVGKWEQCFSADDIETFPTGEPVIALKEYAESLWAFAKRSMAILVELPGSFQWQGPWAISAAGQEAFCKTPYGPMWLNDRNQLCTMSQDGPIPVSGAYERGMLSKIGAPYQLYTRVVYECDPSKDVDRVVVKGRDVNGNPFHVYHDFKLRNASSIYATTYAWQGEAYESVYQGQLAGEHIIAAAHDGNGIERVWAGGFNGQIYQLSNGCDDIGFQFTADGITLINAGPERPTLDYIEWYGDSTVKWSVAQTLDAGLSSFVDITPSFEQAPDGVRDFQYRVSLPTPELKHIFVRFQLTSRPAVLNPGFELNTGGTPVNTPIAVGASIGDQWTLYDNPSGFFSAELESGSGITHSGNGDLFLRLNANQTIPPSSGGTSESRVRSSAIAIPAGSLSLTLSGWRRWDNNASPPAGIVIAQRISIAFFDAGMGFISEVLPAPDRLTVNGAYELVSGVIAVPANAAFCEVQCCIFLQNNNGTPLVIGAGVLYADQRFDDLSLFFVGPNGFNGLNDPPHVPLETYGRIYMVDPLVGESRGHTP